ncbi:MAG: hypothetical protein KJ767_02870 [Nanoarchaeota archaeon]|nr:hypothetical protein [Nanoarchaeota archaeon]
MVDEYVEKGAYENFYIGNYTPFEPDFGEYFTGYRVPAAQLGAPTSPQTADQIRQATRLLNTGMKVVEIGAIQPQVFEGIPKQHFKEIGRLAELTGTDVTVHGPIAGIDMAGFTEQGWQEQQRVRAEKQIIDTLEKAYQINPKGKIPVTFHGGVPIQRWRYLDEKERKELLEKFPDTREEVKREIESGKVRDFMYAVDPETGQMQGIRFEERVWPEGRMVFDPKRRIDMINQTQWSNDNFELAVLQEQKARLASMIPAEQYGMLKEKIAQVPKEDFQRTLRKYHNREQLNREEEKVIQTYSELQRVEAPLRETNEREYMKLREMYNDFMKYGNKDAKEVLEKYTEKEITPITKRISDARRTGDGEEYRRAHEALQSDQTLNGLRNTMAQLPAPEKWQPADDFAKNKIAETAANAAFSAWKKFGNNAPTLALENYPDSAMSTGEESAAVVQEARKRFVEIAQKKGVSPESAKVASERLIGLTWDLGHINMMRKYGFSEKFVVEETKKAAPYIQKTHLADNFGFDDAHLPPGMGNVPFKEALAEIEKAGIKVPNIVEAGGFVQHFKTSPHPYVLEALGSPLYTYMSEPYWNQARASYGSYFQGYGEFLPDFHFRAYGSPSFSALPTELGGEMPGEKRQTFSGQGME